MGSAKFDAQKVDYNMIHECIGKKSYENNMYTGDITPGETNESCLHSTTQEEPLEVIDLDEIYKLNQER